MVDRRIRIGAVENLVARRRSPQQARLGELPQFPVQGPRRDPGQAGNPADVKALARAQQKQGQDPMPVGAEKEVGDRYAALRSKPLQTIIIYT